MKDFIRTYKKTVILMSLSLVLLALVNFIFGSIVASLLLGIGTLAIYSYLFFRAGEQALRPFDGLTGLRYIVLYTIIAGGILTVPGIVFNALQLIGEDVELIRSIVRITNGLSRIVVPILLVFVFEYKNRE